MTRCMIVVAGLAMATCVHPTFAGGGGASTPVKLTVFQRIDAGQVLLYATMPPPNGKPLFLCAILQSKIPGEFRGHFAATGFPDADVAGSVMDFYECVPSPYPAGVQARLVSDVNLEGPIGVSGQVQYVPTQRR